MLGCIQMKGGNMGEYSAQIACVLNKERYRKKSKEMRFTEQMKSDTQFWLKDEKLSPELISARWKKNGQESVSHETIYDWIWESKKSTDRNKAKDRGLYKDLRHGKGKQKRGNHKHTRGLIKHRTHRQRPAFIEDRHRLGDIEVDLMMGRNHQSALLVMTDRATLITTMDYLPGKDSQLVKKKIEERINWIGASWIKTLTFDNDQAFALHHEIASEYGIKTFFTRPYTSQDKGTVENRIGLIRAFLPKRTDLNEISDETIADIENKMVLPLS